ncbi:MAG: hypothetical protein ABIM89_01800 [Mycobacteriales bacterium]
MGRFGRGPGALRRWSAVAGAVGVLCGTPYAVGRLPAADAAVPPGELLELIVASAEVPHSGYAESTARIGLPGVPQIDAVLDLLGETTRMRVWWAAGRHWRVDALGLAGERGMYRDAQGLVAWDSGERRVTRQRGESEVRLARPSDLLPTELGRRLAAAARSDEITALRSRRVAGISAAGLRITARSVATTIGRVDIWADPGTGVPLRVEVTERGSSYAAITTGFLEYSRQAPTSQALEFVPASDVRTDYVDAPDIARFIGTFSPFVLPAAAGGTPRRSAVGRAGGTYGSGYDVVAVLVLPGRQLRRAERALDDVIAPTERPYGTVTVITAPVLNALVVVPPGRPGYGYLLSGAVSVAELERLAAGLVAEGVAGR